MPATREAWSAGVQAAIVIDGTVVGAVGVSGGIPADLDHAIAEAAVRAGRHSAGPRSGKLRLDLLHERLHSRQGAVIRLRGGLEHDVLNPNLLEGTESITIAPTLPLIGIRGGRPGRGGYDSTRSETPSMDKSVRAENTGCP